MIIFDGLKLVIELVCSQSMPLEFLKAVPHVREDLTNKLHRHSSSSGFQCHCLFSSISTTTSTNIETILGLIWSHDTNNLPLIIIVVEWWLLNSNSCSRGCKKARKSIWVPLALHFGCHGISDSAYYVLVPIYMWIKDQVMPKGQPIWEGISWLLHLIVMLYPYDYIFFPHL